MTSPQNLVLKIGIQNALQIIKKYTVVKFCNKMVTKSCKSNQNKNSELFILTWLSFAHALRELEDLNFYISLYNSEYNNIFSTNIKIKTKQTVPMYKNVLIIGII